MTQTIFIRFKNWLLPAPHPEKAVIDKLIEQETERFNGERASLTEEVRVVKKIRKDGKQVFDDALLAMKKEYKK